MGIPSQIPTGMAPLNSTTGMAEIVARTAHLGRPNDMKKFAIFCPVCKCSVVAAALAKAGDCNKTRLTSDRAALLTHRL